jgi:predicted  nucleic acid-binding Zn-ribbon protein
MDTCPDLPDAPMPGDRINTDYVEYCALVNERDALKDQVSDLATELLNVRQERDGQMEGNDRLNRRVAELEAQLADSKQCARYETDVAEDAIQAMNRFRETLAWVEENAMDSGTRRYDLSHRAYIALHPETQQHKQEPLMTNLEGMPHEKIQKILDGKDALIRDLDRRLQTCQERADCVRDRALIAEGRVAELEAERRTYCPDDQDDLGQDEPPCGDH